MYPLNRPERIDDMLPDMFRRFFRPVPWMEGGDPSELRLDVTENEKAYEVAAPVPGARREDIEVSVDGNLVSIAVETKEEKEEKKGDRVLLRECRYGRSSRSFTLAQPVDSTAVAARLEDGVLRLTLPKQEGAAARKIAIR
jgi:HSP20 family protein